MAEPDDEDSGEEDSPDPHEEEPADDDLIAGWNVGSPGPPHRLEYRSPREERRGRPEPSMGAQVGMGFVAWLGTVTVLAVLMWAVSTSGVRSLTTIYFLLALAVGVIITLCVHVRTQYRWRGFIPGVLLGFGVTCLLPLGILTILCGRPF